MPADVASAPPAGPVVIDASAVVEYLVELTLPDPATRLFQQVAEGRVELWAPDLVYPESASALRKLVRLEAVAAADAEIAMENLVELPISIAGTAALMRDVWRMQAFLTPYDACYVALADALGAELVTAERKLAAELGKRRKRARFLGAL